MGVFEQLAALGLDGSTLVFAGLLLRQQQYNQLIAEALAKIGERLARLETRLTPTVTPGK